MATYTTGEKMSLKALRTELMIIALTTTLFATTHANSAGIVQMNVGATRQPTIGVQDTYTNAQLAANNWALSDSRAAYGGNASASLSFTEGTLRASTLAPSTGSAYAIADISDSLTFARSGDVRIWYELEGSTSPLHFGGTDGDALGTVSIAVAGIARQARIQNNSLGGCINFPSNGVCSTGSEINAVGYFDFAISAGSNVFDLSLSASSSGGGFASFANTAKFYIQPLDGNVFVSSSGQFFSQADLPVPEPSEAVLLLTGVFCLALWRGLGRVAVDAFASPRADL